MLTSGRLIFPMWAAIVRLDPAATKVAGQHPFLHEPLPSNIPVAGAAGARRVDTRRYMPPVFVQAQVERGQYQAQRQGQGGNVPDSRVTLVLLAEDLRRLGLLDPQTGQPLLKVDDKLLGTWASCSEAKTASAALLKQGQAVGDPPGLWCTQIAPAGEGLVGRRNLFLMTFDDREHGVVRGS